MTEPTDPSAAPARGRLSDNRLGLAALAVSVVALGVALIPQLTGGFDGRVRAYLLENPQVLQEASEALQDREDQARVGAVAERVAANPALLAPDPRDPAFGPADAKVTVVEFFDFRCPGCKATAPDVIRLMQTHPDVRFVFKDWPILDRDPSGPSHQAARAALAAHQQGRYLPVFRQLMAESDLNAASIQRILAANGVDLAQAEAAAQGPAVTRHLADIQTAGTTLQLVGTPTFFVNGVPQASIQPAELDRAIRTAKAGRPVRDDQPGPAPAPPVAASSSAETAASAD